MILRILGQHISAAAEKMPVVAITGPRQSGKSTLVQQIFPTHVYLNLEDIEHRKFALSDPKGFLQNLGGKAILDEVQYAPDLLSYIQVAVDREKVPGQFVISGSQNLLLMESVAQSLAGRVAIFNLLPFALEEIRDTAFAMPAYEDYVLKGFYPRIYDLDLNPTNWLLDYIKTYVECPSKSNRAEPSTLIFSTAWFTFNPCRARCRPKVFWSMAATRCKNAVWRTC